VINLNEKRQKRAALVVDARAILDVAEKENRDLTTEENDQYERIMKDVDKIGAEVEAETRAQERRQKLDGLDKELNASQGRFVGGQEQGDQDENQDQRNIKPRDTKEYRSAFREYVCGGRDALSAEQIRSLQADSATKGGYLVAPTQFVAELLADVKDELVIEQLARTFTLEKAESLGVPTRESTLDDFEWTGEVSTTNEDDGIAFGKRELIPHPLSKLVKISGKLLRLGTMMDPEGIIREELAYVLGGTKEKSYMTGSGSNQPLGLFTASADGITTARDVSTGNTATDIKGDGLIEAKFSLKSQYLKNARWLFHRDAIKGIRKLKDANGNYIWMAGLTSGQPDKILEVPYIMSEFAPHTFTASRYVGIIGDFRFYWIVNALNMEIQRLVELFSLNNKIGFVVRAESDAAPARSEAFARVKLGT
jgi:HK97 family phage major capsid protein